MSFAGNVTFKNAGQLREALEVAPRALLLVETDAPFLTPTPYRGRPNAPYLIPHTLRAMADHLRTDVSMLAAQISSNTELVYGRWDSEPVASPPTTPIGSGRMNEVRLLGPAEIRDLAELLDVTPTKKLGQNFVIDANTVRRIVRVAGVEAGDSVVEVGPGLGSLTLGLLEAGASVVAVEIDGRLARQLPVTVEHARAVGRRPADRRPPRCARRHRARRRADQAGGQPAVQRVGARSCCIFSSTSRASAPVS